MSLFSMYMDRIRHILAVVAFVIHGPGLLFWFLIPPVCSFLEKTWSSHYLRDRFRDAEHDWC